MFFELLGLFIAGATPWLEALLVVPAGIAAGLPFGAVILSAVAGNLLTVAIAVWFGEAIRNAWEHRKAKRTPPVDGLESEPLERRPSRSRRVFERWGLPGLAILGPIGLGTQVSAALAVALGQGRKTTFLWISLGTGAWALVAGVLALGGLRILS